MASVDKILIGSPTYKTVVGNVTRVHKVVVGTPLSTVVIGPYADIDNIIGLDTSAKTEGGVITYDSDLGTFYVNNELTIKVDGGIYPVGTSAPFNPDSDYSNILIRRSGTAGEPTDLQQGEMGYSYFPDPGTDGFGNGGDRLYIGVGANDPITGISSEIDVIGGTYFTNLMTHQQGVLTANAALLTGPTKSLNQILADSATFTNIRATTAFVSDLQLTASSITADSAVLRDRDDIRYLSWSNGVSGEDSAGLKGYYNDKLVFQTDSATGFDESGNPISIVGLKISEGFLEVNGTVTADKLSVRGDALINGNLRVNGETTYLNTSELLVTDKRIVIAKNIPTARDADQSGIAVGDSNTPIATITYVNNGIDSASWTFDPGIIAPYIKVDELTFDVIDCGKYA